MNADQWSPAGAEAEGEPRLRGGSPHREAASGEDDFGPEDFDEDFDGLSGVRTPGGRRYVIYAPHGNINTGSVHGDQHVRNGDSAAGQGGRRVEAHEGPISPLEILDARAGFAEPDWFPAALRELGTGILFLTGEPGTGRRTAALNLLYRHSGHSMDLRALDSDEDLSLWRPTHAGTRGYLVYGLFPHYPLGPAVIANLRRLLTEADARMVIVLPDDPELVRGLSRDLHVSPVRCVPPRPRAVFDARLEAAVPGAAQRARLLARLDAGLLEELLTPELLPAQVAELVTAVSEAGEDGPDPAGLRQRLSFLAEGEAPDLLKNLHDDADGLAFLLATCVFEGLDHRIVREEAERLLTLADGRLDSVLPEGEGQDGGHGRPGPPRPNPRFMFRRSLDDLLRTVRAQCAPSEIRAGSRYSYAVEPVRFTRHRQAETVLRHVWRQYGQLSGLLTEWLDNVPVRDTELAEPVGRFMGMAAGWGGGRRALRHIHELAGSDHTRSRRTAAYALGIAAEDPVLASEVKHHLTTWSGQAGWRRRSTVAYACGTDFGASRPDPAMSLLRRSYRGDDGDERQVAAAVRQALEDLFAAGNQPTVFRRIAEWADRSGPEAKLALRTFPALLPQSSWFEEQLLNAGEFTEKVVDLVRRSLNDDRHFDGIRDPLLGWCRTAAWNERLRAALETLLIALAQEMRHGVLRLFVEIDRDDNPELAGRHIAHHALEAWRAGEPQPFNPTHPHGGSDDRRE
ncbi:hypothetical protein [Kitasatospora sp. HPMI-4]|uniref:hypothetical protein n=1 Tax=Kitasatospora sp. HPMI-4 TaxID=3448443 RepID=UPI003F1C82EB